MSDDSTVDGFGVVVSAADLCDVFGEELVHTVELPVSDGVLQRFWDESFPVTQDCVPVLMASASADDFPWELMNRLALTAHTVGKLAPPDVVGEERPWALPAPSLVHDHSCLDQTDPRPAAAVILVRRNATLVSSVHALSRIIARADIPVAAVVIVDGESRRWRRWRRFASNYGVWSDPKCPWPAIDVLDAEKRRGTTRDA